MTSTRKPARRWALLALAAAVAGPGLAHAAAIDMLYERTVMTAADSRCRLFAPAVSAALDAGRAQARNTALRAGTDEAAVAAVEQRARAKAAGAACDAPDLAMAATRVRDAFEGFSKVTRLTYPGDVAGWRADRNAGRAARWRLSQDVSFGWDRMTFGLAGRDGEGALLAVADFPDGATPYAARLVMRDADRSSGAYLDRRGADVNGRLPLARRLPAAYALKTFQAAARSPAGSDLAARTMKQPWAFRFPPEAAARLAALDPREAVAVDFVMPDDTVRRAYVEVGDFAPGRAFLRLAQQ
ncbi:hypothetical protein [Phenylobacterium sp.]|jgi:hypothetical protein|uniref:hypothetical protein n=1 Tax=Phenylobacterium sp. TaxID=1871053 RepID=UPI002F3F6667